MDSETLRKVQLVQLEIAKEISRVCDENGIKYFLTGGTLLGAVRHGGFIPWDDDLDIGMFRQDYEKFLEIAPVSLREQYRIIDWKSDQSYPHPMGKVIKKGTLYKESKRKDQGEQGIWVDVFPYDNIPNLNNDFQARIFKLKILRGLVRAKCNYQTWHSENGVIWSKYIKNLPFRVVSVFMKKENLIKKYEAISTINNNKECTFVFENGPENYSEWCFKKEIFSNLVERDFENCKFLIPEKYHEYLRAAYGDYMVLPPIEKRENQHLIVEVSFVDE